MKKILIAMAVMGALIVPPAVAYMTQKAEHKVEHVVKQEVKKSVEKNIKKVVKKPPVKKDVAPQQQFPQWNP
jgi:hypothetical protein